MLRRYNVDRGLGKIIEYFGPGLKSLTAMDRHVIANMGAELGATTSVFPSDDAVLAFLKSQGREEVFKGTSNNPKLAPPRMGRSIFSRKLGNLAANLRPI
jgi:aconitate hydratase